MIRIRSKKPGFRRGGMAHAAEWTEYPDDRFIRKQLAQLQAEPMLQVEIVPDTDDEAPPEKAPPGDRKPAKAAKK